MDNILNKKPIKEVDGLSLFCEDQYWGKAPESELKEAIKVVDEDGWGAFDNRFDKKFDYSIDESKADWHFNIPINKDSLILDIGAGLGRHSIPLSYFAGKVIAADNSVSRMRFLKRLVNKRGINNVDVIIADIFNLPFKEKSFDVIVLNGLLEWVGKTKLFKNHRDAQVAAVCICKKLLKDGGYLYIGIENRFALSYLRGYDHSGLRYTSYLPRIIADWYCRLRGRGAYDTYTYSKRGYVKLLKEGGFKVDKMQFFLPYPGYNSPRIIIPYDQINMLSYAIRSMMSSGGWKRKIVKKISSFNLFLRIYRKLFFSFNIIIKND